MPKESYSLTHIPNRIVHSYESLAKFQNSVITSLSNSKSKDATEFALLYTSLDAKRYRDVRTVHWNVCCILLNLREIENELRHLERHKDTSFFKNKIAELEKKIRSHKKDVAQEMKKLAKEQSVLEIYVNEMQDVVEAWTLSEFQPKRIPMNKHCTTPKVIHKFDPRNEVGRFLGFLKSSGGHTGGWKEEKHLLFLKLRAKKSLEEVAEIMCFQFPDLKEEDIFAHEHWFLQYSDLKSEYRNAQIEWRTSKDLRTKNWEGESNGSTQGLVKSKDETSEIKRRIRKWKEEQQESQREIESVKAEEKRKHEMSLKNRELRRRKDQLKKKETVEMYKEIKKRKREFETNEETNTFLLKKKQLAAHANFMLKKFRRREKEKYKALKQKKQQQVFSKTLVRDNKTTVKVARDPQRVFKYTEAWAEKLRGDQNKPALLYSAIMNIKGVSHLKCPDWCTNMSPNVRLVE